MTISYVFLPHLFSLETSNYLRLNRNTIFQACLLQVQYFSQLQHVNTRSTKLESHFCHFSSSIQAFYKIKKEDHITSMFTVGLIFFLARECQHKTNKIGITILSPSQLKLRNLQDRNYFKSTYLAQFNSPRKYLKQQISYFYQILHFKINPTKFGLPHLDTPSSRYEFLNFVTKSMKKLIKKIKFQIGRYSQVHSVYTPRCD